MSNLISRRDVFNEILKISDHLDTDMITRLYIELNMLPSAQPEQRKKGRWIDYSDEGFVECPFCHSATNCDDNKKELHYCFSCGASMEEGEAE